MDPRRAIFRLWTDAKFEDRRLLVEELLRCGNLYEAVNEAKLMGFKCGMCNKYRKVNGIGLDALWVVATCPEKYLYEGEVIVCGACTNELYGNYVLVMFAKRIGRGKCLSLVRGVPHSGYRYVYNPLHNYYILMEQIPNSDQVDIRQFCIVYRSDCPSRNPYFHIDNTLFTILS